MSRPKYAAKVDGSHGAVVKAFERMGCSVLVIGSSSVSGVPDLLVGTIGLTHLVEVKPADETRIGDFKPHKTSKRQRTPRKSQVDWAASWRGGSVALVRSADDVAELVGMWRRHRERSVQAAIALAHGVAPSTGLQEGPGGPLAAPETREADALVEGQRRRRESRMAAKRAEAIFNFEVKR